MRKLSDFPDAHLRIFDRPSVPAPENIQTVYLIGICGTGMGSLAGLFQQAGYAVRGADRAAWPPMSTRLREVGIPILEGYDPAHLDPTPDLVIVGNACTPTHVEAAYAREQGLVQLSFPEALAHFFIQDRRSLVVTGTHGKTSTTGLLVHVFRTAQLDPGFLVGGVMVNGNVNFDVGQAGRHFIVEGDEYDSAYFDKQPKFMHYRPTSAIVTSMEFDHADIYDDIYDYQAAFERFAATLPETGLLALCNASPHVLALADYTQARVRTYGLTPDANVTATNIRAVPGGQRFTLVVDGNQQIELYLPLSGQHNLLNALAVCTIALDEGLTLTQLADGLASFKGLKRRQEVRGEVNGVLVIDDFAHHPTAVRETLAAIHMRWPHRRLIAVFEPRSNSSRRKVFETAYPEAFQQADRVYLSTPPQRHNDRADDFMDIAVVAERIWGAGAPTFVGTGPDAVLDALIADVAPGDAVLIMSNGGFGNIHERLLNALAPVEIVD